MNRPGSHKGPGHPLCSTAYPIMTPAIPGTGAGWAYATKGKSPPPGGLSPNTHPSGTLSGP